MLSSVLNSLRFIQVDMGIMRVFTRNAGCQCHVSEIILKNRHVLVAPGPSKKACAHFIKDFRRLKLAAAFYRAKDEKHFLLKENLRPDISLPAEMGRKLENLEKKYEVQFKMVFDAIRKPWRYRGRNLGGLGSQKKKARFRFLAKPL